MLQPLLLLLLLILRSANDSFDNVEVPPITETEWLNHFQSLHADNNENDDWLKEDLKRLEQKSSVNNNLDNPISDQELFARIQTLKIKKASGVDKISNEMIKSSIYLLSTVYRKLFSIVLNSAFFPESWSLSIITPIFKAGVRNNPGNYRGICVSSCLGKFFCSILNERLINYYDKNNIIHRSQTGFRPGFRTSDHIFTLRTLVDKYVNTVNQGKIYVCFVDFKKAFDSVWHKGLLHKLLSVRIGCNFFNVIKDMYYKTRCCMKLNSSITGTFNYNREVRQGCVLSPALFNLF